VTLVWSATRAFSLTAGQPAGPQQLTLITVPTGLVFPSGPNSQPFCFVTFIEDNDLTGQPLDARDVYTIVTFSNSAGAVDLGSAQGDFLFDFLAVKEKGVALAGVGLLSPKPSGEVSLLGGTLSVTVTFPFSTVAVVNYLVLAGIWDNPSLLVNGAASYNAFSNSDPTSVNGGSTNVTPPSTDVGFSVALVAVMKDSASTFSPFSWSNPTPWANVNSATAGNLGVTAAMLDTNPTALPVSATNSLSGLGTGNAARHALPSRAPAAMSSRRCGVAQPGDHNHGIHEVMGSIPISSTNSSNNLAGRRIR